MRRKENHGGYLPTQRKVCYRGTIQYLRGYSAVGVCTYDDFELRCINTQVNEEGGYVVSEGLGVMPGIWNWRRLSPTATVNL